MVYLDKPSVVKVFARFSLINRAVRVLVPSSSLNESGSSPAIGSKKKLVGSVCMRCIMNHYQQKNGSHTKVRVARARRGGHARMQLCKLRVVAVVRPPKNINAYVCMQVVVNAKLHVLRHVPMHCLLARYYMSN